MSSNFHRYLCGLALVTAAADLIFLSATWASSTSLTELTGHSKGVNDVAFSGDGEVIATASDDGTVRVWATNGVLTRILHGHSARVASLAFCPSGERLATASDDSTVRIWDLETGLETRTLHGHTKGISAIAYSPDGGFIVSTGWDQTLRLWNLESGTSAFLRRTNQAMRCVGFSPSGVLIVTGGDKGSLTLWDPAELHVIRELHGHTGAVTCVAFSSDGRMFATAGDDRVVRIWDAHSLLEVKTIDVLDGGVGDVCFIPATTLLVAGSRSGRIITMDLAEGKTLAAAYIDLGQLKCVATHPDGGLLVAGGSKTFAVLWSR